MLLLGSLTMMAGCAAPTPVASEAAPLPSTEAVTTEQSETSTPSAAAVPPPISNATDYCTYLLDDPAVRQFVDAQQVDYQSLWTPDAVTTYPASAVIGHPDVVTESVSCNLSTPMDFDAPHSASIVLTVNDFYSDAEVERVRDTPEETDTLLAQAALNFDVLRVDDPLGGQGHVLYAKESQTAQMSGFVGDKTFLFQLQGDMGSTVGTSSIPDANASSFLSPEDVEALLLRTFEKMRVAPYPEGVAH